MKFKELITRSVGMITAIALLGSMMSVAGAARDGTYTCSLCGVDIPYGQYGNDSGNSTYQQYYSVGEIASAVSAKIENAVTAANVVFTVAWDK